MVRKETSQKHTRLNDIMFNINKLKTKEKVQEACKEACRLMVEIGILDKEDQNNIPKAFHLYQEYVKQRLQADIVNSTTKK